MLYARDGDALLLHGSIASRLVNALGAGIPACISVTHVDGLVLARSHFHHSVNYRSVVAFGIAQARRRCRTRRSPRSRASSTRSSPGRAAESRPPDRNELAATNVLRFEIEDASAKVRSGGVKDDAADLGAAALGRRRAAACDRTVRRSPTRASRDGSGLPRSVQRLLAARRSAHMSDAIRIVDINDATGNVDRAATGCCGAEAVHRQLRPHLPHDYAGKMRRVFADGARMCVAVRDERVVGVAVYRIHENTCRRRADVRRRSRHRRDADARKASAARCMAAPAARSRATRAARSSISIPARNASRRTSSISAKAWS